MTVCLNILEIVIVNVKNVARIVLNIPKCILIEETMSDRMFLEI